jgi:hypothetical protein
MQFLIEKNKWHEYKTGTVWGGEVVEGRMRGE